MKHSQWGGEMDDPRDNNNNKKRRESQLGLFYSFVVAYVIVCRDNECVCTFFAAFLDHKTVPFG